MAHGFKDVGSAQKCKPQVKSVREGKGIGSRRMFSTQFKLQVLDSYRQDADCRGNQRATARKYGIHRRQIQKWLQMESSLRCSAEAGEVALNLAGQSRQQGGACVAGCLPATQDEEEELNVDKISDSEDEVSSGESLYEQEQALDFTCANLSRRRFYSLSFKLEVLDAFYNDRSCCRNQRATALKFGVHRRQVQKWLNQEGLLRGEAAGPVAVPMAAVSPATRDGSPCLDLRKRKLDEFSGGPEPKKMYLDLDDGRRLIDEMPMRRLSEEMLSRPQEDLPHRFCEDIPTRHLDDITTRRLHDVSRLHDVPRLDEITSAQETALCLVKPSPLRSPCEVSSTLDPYRPCNTSPCCSPYFSCCDQQPFYDCWPSYPSCPYACITTRLNHDAHYYKQAIKDINLYAPPTLYSS